MEAISYITRTTYFVDILFHGQPMALKSFVDKPHTTRLLQMQKFFRQTTHDKFRRQSKKGIKLEIRKFCFMLALQFIRKYSLMTKT